MQRRRPQITSSAWTPRKGYSTIGKTANQKENENARYRCIEFASSKKKAQHYKPLMESTHFYFHHSHNYAFPEEQEHEKGLGSTFKSIAHGLITETEAGMRLTGSVLPRWWISLIIFRPP